MKKTIKIISISIAVILLSGLLFFANAFVGNPVSKFLVNKSADRHIAEQYGDLDLVRGETTFNFKDGNYFIKLHSDEVEDLHFSMYYSMLGKLQLDLY